MYFRGFFLRIHLERILFFINEFETNLILQQNHQNQKLQYNKRKGHCMAEERNKDKFVVVDVFGPWVNEEANQAEFSDHSNSARQ